MTDPTVGHRPLRRGAARSTLLALLLALALPAASWAGGDTLFKLSDPRGDDHGDGSLVYPLSSDFSRGDLDLLAFSARRGDGGTWFEATFARPVRAPGREAIDDLGTSLSSIARYGFYTLNIDVYIDTDRVPGSGGVMALPGRKVRIAPDSAWDRAIVLTPRPHEARGELKRLLMKSLEEEMDRDDPDLELAQAVEMRHRIPMDVEQRVFFPTLVRVQGQRISFFVPDSFLGGPARADWSYVVAVSGANLSQSFGLAAGAGLAPSDPDTLMILPVLPGRSANAFGGRDRPAFEPPLVDILVPEGVSQEEVLGSFDSREKTLAEVPGVVPGGASK